jgi:hypothetical protein
MRDIAASLYTDADASRWLGSDLLPKILSVLRSIAGSGASSDQAVRVSAAATAALNNLFMALPRPEDQNPIPHDARG